MESRKRSGRKEVCDCVATPRENHVLPFHSSDYLFAVLFSVFMLLE